MEEFSTSRRHFRKRGQRMAEYMVMWDAAVEKMLEVGIDVVAWGDLAGWLFLRGAGLIQDRHERVLMALPDDSYPLDKLREMLIPSSQRSTRARVRL